MNIASRNAIPYIKRRRIADPAQREHPPQWDTIPSQLNLTSYDTYTTMWLTIKNWSE